jgi:hypothetical protein
LILEELGEHQAPIGGDVFAGLETLGDDDVVVARRWGALPAERIGSAELALRWTGTHPAVMQPRIGRGDLGRVVRRGPLETALLRPRFYAMWLRKWGVLPRWEGASPR